MHFSTDAFENNKSRQVISIEEDVELFSIQMNTHVQRIIDASGSSHSNFCTTHLSEDIIRQLASFAAEKMQLTARDNSVHSIGIGKSPVYYTIWTISEELQNAKIMYSNNFHGYSNVLNFCLNSDEFNQLNSEVLVHITYSRTDSVWVNVSIIPVSNCTSEFDFDMILAMDMFNREEIENIRTLFNN